MYMAAAHSGPTNQGHKMYTFLVTVQRNNGHTYNTTVRQCATPLDARTAVAALLPRSETIVRVKLVPNP